MRVTWPPMWSSWFHYPPRYAIFSILLWLLPLGSKYSPQDAVLKHPLSVKFEVLKAVKVWIVVFWIVMPCGLAYGYQRFGETHSLRLQDSVNMETTFIRNIDYHLQDHMASRPRRPQGTFNLPLTRKTSFRLKKFLPLKNTHKKFKPQMRSFIEFCSISRHAKALPGVRFWITSSLRHSFSLINKTGLATVRLLHFYSQTGTKQLRNETGSTKAVQWILWYRPQISVMYTYISLRYHTRVAKRKVARAKTPFLFSVAYNSLQQRNWIHYVQN
jgi:hypothetical protein